MDYSSFGPGKSSLVHFELENLFTASREGCIAAAQLGYAGVNFLAQDGFPEKLPVCQRNFSSVRPAAERLSVAFRPCALNCCVRPTGPR